MINVKVVENQEELDLAYHVRTKVFIEEQACPPEEEFDEYDQECRHLLALSDGNPAGTARWRYTAKGVKLERFAVLKEFRGNKVGASLVDFIIKDIDSQEKSKGKIKYLYAQLSAMPLYQKFGFKPFGERFWEVGIEHQAMELI